MTTARSPLSQLGYNLVALPKTDIKPMLLLYKTDGGVSSVEADLSEMFKSDDLAPPQAKKDIDTANVNGSSELTFDADGGVNILDWLLNKLKLGKMEAKISFDDNFVVTVSYSNVTEDKVNLLELDRYISQSTPDKDQFNAFREKLENSDLYVINSVLKSNTLSVKIEGKNGLDISANATVKGILDANASVARKTSNSITLDYTKDTPLIFAFKAQQIIYQKASFWKSEPASFHIKNQIGVTLLGEEAFPAIPLEMGPELVEL